MNPPPGRPTPENAGEAADAPANLDAMMTIDHMATQGGVPTWADPGDPPPLATSLATERGAGSVASGPHVGAASRYGRRALHASGGMGSVWRAHDDHLGREVALKELRAEGSTAGTISSRFLREARITGQLEHPGIVPVYELHEDPETRRPFYTMRFVRGRTLTEVAGVYHHKRRSGQADPLDLVALLTAFVSVCNTIAYAHSRGVIHRDLKGENIILGDFGEVIVLDWGLAKRLRDGADSEPRHHDEDLEQDLPAEPTQTVMGQVMGTPAYMAPEQAEGRLDLLGPCTDIFGLGAILYEILTGRPPFSGVNTLDVLHKAIRGEMRPPRVFWAEVPPAMEAFCLKAMARAPADRHASARELAMDIQGWQDTQRRLAEDELRQAGERLRRQQAAVVALTRSQVFSGPDLAATFRLMTEMAARTLNVERVSIWRYREDRRAIFCASLYELGEDRHSEGTELGADAFPNYFDALAATEVIAADDAQTDPRTREFTETYLRPLNIVAMMEVPIHPSAILCHEHIGPPRKWLPDEQLFAVAVGNLAAHVISQWERRQALDQLTANRRSQEE